MKYLHEKYLPSKLPRTVAEFKDADHVVEVTKRFKGKTECISVFGNIDNSNLSDIKDIQGRYDADIVYSLTARACIIQYEENSL